MCSPLKHREVVRGEPPSGNPPLPPVLRNRLQRCASFFVRPEVFIWSIEEPKVVFAHYEEGSGYKDTVGLQGLS